MSETGAWAGSWARGATASRPGGRPRGRRAAGLWALFHAQTLLADTMGTTDAFALAEDDRYRLSAERGAEGDGLSLRYR
jgi:hypothetical protein